MIGRPQVIAFAVVETLFPLEPLRQRLVDAGQPPGVLELWFARLLRDGFALAASGGYRPFAEVAVAALASVTRDALTAQVVDRIVAGFAELDPRPEVDPALRRAVDSGIRVIALTNGSERNTQTLLHRAGVERDVLTVPSVDGVRRWKPAPGLPVRGSRVRCAAR